MGVVPGRILVALEFALLLLKSRVEVVERHLVTPAVDIQVVVVAGVIGEILSVEKEYLVEAVNTLKIVVVPAVDDHNDLSVVEVRAHQEGLLRHGDPRPVGVAVDGTGPTTVGPGPGHPPFRAKAAGFDVRGHVFHRAVEIAHRPLREFTARVVAASRSGLVALQLPGRIASAIVIFGRCFGRQSASRTRRNAAVVRRHLALRGEGDNVAVGWRGGLHDHPRFRPVLGAGPRAAAAFQERGRLGHPVRTGRLEQMARLRCRRTTRMTLPGGPNL